MSKERGVTNLKIALDLVIEVANVIDKARSGPKGIGKLAGVFDLIDEVSKLSDFDFGELKLEYKDLKADERAALVEHIKNKFDIADNALEFKIEQASEIFIKISALVPQAISLVGDFKEVVKKKPRKKKVEAE
jgi:hypothetical protein